MHDDRDDPDRSETDEIVERLLADDEAFGRMQEGIEQARRGEGIPLEELASQGEGDPPEERKSDDA